MKLRIVWLASALALIATTAHAQIYRCVDMDGQVRFRSDPAGCTSFEVLRSEGPERTAAAKPEPDAAEADESGPTARNPYLADLFVPAAAVMGRWEIVLEAPESPSRELRAQGLRESLARHYTRARGPVSDVCTVELWRFDYGGQAQAVAGYLAQPGWQILRTGDILVLLHGVSLELRAGSTSGLVEGCAELGERTRARIVADR